MTDTLYKITDADGWTRKGHDNACLWSEGVTHKGTGEGNLCGPGWIHAYIDPHLAVLFNPIHGNYDNFRLWEAEGEIVKRDHQLKVGCKSLTVIREVDVPTITTEQRIRFAIFCARSVYNDKSFIQWSDDWLNGNDRSARAARAARAAARAA